jgi:hypothetical protein
VSWLTFEPGTNGIDVRGLLLEITLNNHGYLAFTVVQMTRYPSVTEILKYKKIKNRMSSILGLDVFISESS